jgi:hypothetical protein
MHLLAWLILTPVIVLGFVFGIAARRAVPTQTPPVVEDLPQSTPPATEVRDR